MATNSFVQVPPDGAGKKLFTQEHIINGNTVQVQVLHASDPDTPENIQKVDSRGAASVRFSEGSPLSDGFGNLKVSQTTCIGNYEFVMDSGDDLFSDTIAGGGLITYLSDASTMQFTVETASGDRAYRVTNKHHYYLPGTSNYGLMTVALTDDHMQGCDRRWGMMNDHGGIGFRLDENGILNVGKVSSVSGTPVELWEPQSNWNGDKLDGTGLSQFVLDMTKLNIYWMDYQWLGAGRIRMGVLDEEGNRIVAHTILNANNNLYPWSSMGSFPMSVEIKNTALTGGSAGIRWTCGSVMTEGIPAFTYWRYSHEFPSKSVTANNHHLMSIKSLNEVDGKHNPVGAYPETMSLVVTGGTIKLDIYWDYMTLTTPTWALDNASTVIGDSAGTLVLSGDEYKPKSWYFGAGIYEIDLKPFFEKTDLGLTLQQNGAEAQYVTLAASLVSGTPSVTGMIQYAEMR